MVAEPEIQSEPTVADAPQQPVPEILPEPRTTPLPTTPSLPEPTMDLPVESELSLDDTTVPDAVQDDLFAAEHDAFEVESNVFATDSDLFGTDSEPFATDSDSDRVDSESTSHSNHQPDLHEEPIVASNEVDDPGGALGRSSGLFSKQDDEDDWSEPRLSGVFGKISTLHGQAPNLLTTPELGDQPVGETMEPATTEESASFEAPSTPTPDMEQSSPAAMVQTADRSAVGTITFDDGAALPLRRCAVVGAMVDSGYEIDGEAATIVGLDDGQGGMDPVHLEVRISGNDVVVTDLHSSRGTYARFEGSPEEPTRLPGGQPMRLISGVTIQVGTRSFRYDEAAG